MTHEEVDATVGKARREYREAKNELVTLKTKAHQTGQVAIKLHHALDHPADIKLFDGLPTFSIPNVSRPRQIVMFMEGEFNQLTQTFIKQLADDCQRVEQRCAALREQLTDLEGEDPESHAVGA
jgi:hypothetical protein